MNEVTIIIPIYNVEKYIYDCLQSVSKQTFKKIECLLIDDKSPDNSISIAKQFIGNYKGNIIFKIITHERNRGLSAARNTGIIHSTGRYLYFLDSDDEIYPDTIEALYTAIQKYNSEFSLGNFTIKGESENHDIGTSNDFLPIKDDYLSSNIKIAKAYFKNQWYVMACNKLVRKDFIEKNGLWFPEGLLHEDHYWSLRLACYAKSMSICKKPTYIYKLRKNSISGNITERNIEHLIKILRLCNTITSQSSNPFLKGKLRSVANYTLRYTISSSTDREKKMTAINSIKTIIHQTTFSCPLSLADAIKLVILFLPSKMIYFIVFLFQQLKK